MPMNTTAAENTVNIVVTGTILSYAYTPLINDVTVVINVSLNDAVGSNDTNAPTTDVKILIITSNIIVVC